MSKTDKAHEDQGKNHRALTDALDKKLSDMLGALSGEHDKKHEETRRSLRVQNEELIGMIQSEVTQLVETTNAQFTAITESSKTEIGSIREEVARIVVDLDGKYEESVNHTSASIAMLERNVDAVAKSSSQDMASERECRAREVGDLCSAVKSMQDWVTDVETTFTQRSETRAREIETMNVRLTELKDIQFQLRSEIVKQQEHIDQFKGFQVDKVTDELRQVVQDLANTSDFQGNKIKELEGTLDAAREAKIEVHRLKSDLDAEVSTRTLKDTELQGRLEREVHEFSRRVERLTAATSELGGDLHKSRSTAMRTGSLSVTSLGSANLSTERTRLTQSSGRLHGVSPGLHHVDF